MRMMRKLLLLGALVVGAFAALGGTAMAQAPARGFEIFRACPNRPEVTTCIKSDTKGGSLTLGSQRTTINKTQTVSGGVTDTGEIVFNAGGGMTGDAIDVPGGLAGLTGISEIIINILTLGANRVQARPELVGTPTLFPTFTLPIRVSLRNPFLTSTCGIGSRTSPITLNLTTMTTSPPPPNRPISGIENPFGPDPANPAIFMMRDNRYVDNAFAAPGAAGCDLLGFGLINGLVNSRAGLPSAAGRNEAIFDRTDVRLVARSTVYP